MTDQDKQKILDMFSEKTSSEAGAERKPEADAQESPPSKKEEGMDVAEILKEVEDSQGGIEKAGAKIKSAAGKDDSDEGNDREKKEIEIGAKSIASLETAEEKIEKIILLAQEKGPSFAIQVARRFEDNYILDVAQGELTEDGVYQELVKRGLIKENL